MSQGTVESAIDTDRGASEAPAEGTPIGPYRVVKRLGTGGMGEVLLAYDPRLDRQVAIKRVRPRVSLDEDQRRRLRREARMAARLGHPSIAQVHDLLVVGDVEHIVMEYVPGSTLRDLLELGPPPLPEALRIARRVAEGLGHAHRQGVVHRDLKSENVLLRPEGDVKIVDFGLARPPGKSTETTLTRPGAIVGTCRTMAPEQALGQPVDSRTDLFSFGVLLYELFTGSSPFLARTQVATLQRIVQQRHRSALEHMPELPLELAELIDELLSKDPEERPVGGADDVVDRLRRIADSLRQRSTDDTDPAYFPPETAETVISNRPRELAEREARTALDGPPGSRLGGRFRGAFRGSAPWVGATVLLALALGLLAAWQLGRGASSPPPPEATAEGDPILVTIDTPTAELADGAAEPPLPAAELAVLRQAVRHGLERGLVSLEGVAALADPFVSDEGDERIRSTLTCDAVLCWCEIQRLQDGRLLETTRFQVPADDPLHASIAVAVETRTIYPGKALRPETELRVHGEDFRRYLEVFSQVATVPTGDYPQLIETTSGIRTSSPQFAEAYLLEAELQARLYHVTREETHANAALELLDQARSLTGQESKIVLKEIFLLVALGRIDEAEALLERAEKLAPVDVRLVDRRAQILARSGRGDEALALYERLLALQPTPKVLQNHARLALQLGEFEAARASLESLRARDPESVRVRSMLAELELRGGDLDAADAIYRELAAQDDVASLSGLALVEMLAGRAEDAAATFEVLATRYPQNPEFLLNLADARVLAGDPRAAATYRACLAALGVRDDGSSWRSALTRAQALAHLGDAEGAKKSLETMWGLAPERLEAAYAAATVHALLGSYDEATRHALSARREGLAAHWFELAWFDALPAAVRSHRVDDESLREDPAADP